MQSIASELSLLNVSAINQLLQVTLPYEGSVSLSHALKNFGAVSQTGDQEIEHISYMIDCFQVVVSRQVQSTNH